MGATLGGRGKHPKCRGLFCPIASWHARCFCPLSNVGCEHQLALYDESITSPRRSSRAQLERASRMKTVKLSVIAVGVGMIALVFLPGNANNGGCGGKGGVKTAEDLCVTSGGGWITDCPPCAPPSCGKPVPNACIAICGKKPVCKCPASAPYWQDGQGCVPSPKCASDPTCKQAGGVCAAIVGGRPLCPASNPNPMFGAGSCVQGFNNMGCCI